MFAQTFNKTLIITKGKKHVMSEIPQGAVGLHNTS